MRLKRFFLGGLSLLMLDLFPTFAWASEEVHSVEMSVAAVKQYYRDRDYVSLFDALVFAGGEYTKVMHPSEIYMTRRISFIGQLEHLMPILSKVDKVYLQGDLRQAPTNFVDAHKTPQEVLSGGGAVVHTFGMGYQNFERDLQSGYERTLAVFPPTESYKTQLSMMFDSLKKARRSIVKSSDEGNFSERGWFSCAQLKVGHKLDGALDALENSPRLSTTSAWSISNGGPHPYETGRCRLRGLLSVVGLRGGSETNMAELYTGMDGAPIIGPELRCVLDLLYHPAISDGMDREKALSVLTVLSKEVLHCE